MSSTPTEKKKKRKFEWFWCTPPEDWPSRHRFARLALAPNAHRCLAGTA